MVPRLGTWLVPEKHIYQSEDCHPSKEGQASENLISIA